MTAARQQPDYRGLETAAGALLALAFIALLVCHSAGRLGSLIIGNGWTGPQVMDGDTWRVMLSEGPRVPWPSVAPSLFWALVVAHFVVVLAAAGLCWGKWAKHRQGEAAPLRSGRAAKPWALDRTEARKLRRSLPKRAADEECGLLLGRVGRQRLWASWESTVVAIMAPRAGKTTAVVIPAILAAPGPVLVTSNKADLVADTRSWRRQHRGPTWVFDPQGIANEMPVWSWDPLATVRNADDGRRLAGHFVAIPPGTDPFWALSARELLGLLFLAAGIGGHPITVVPSWLTGQPPRDAYRALDTAGLDAEATALANLLEGPEQTVGGVLMQALTAVSCLRSPGLGEWVTQGTGPLFDAARFVASTETLYLLSEEGPASAGPLLAALADEVISAGRELARRSPGGRLDPPMVATLDEAANVCRLAELPSLYSHLGSQGIIPITILQSRSQAEEVWGRAGFAKLWGSATAKIVGAGIDEADFARDLSTLIGTHPVEERTVHQSGGQRSETISTRDVPILTAADVRKLPKLTALLFGSGMAPVVVDLAPWYQGPQAKAIEAARNDR